MEVEQKKDLVINFSDGTLLKFPQDSLLTDAGPYYVLELEDKLVFIPTSYVRNIEKPQLVS